MGVQQAGAATADGGRWRATLRLTPDGPPVRGGDEDYPSDQAAWDAAFEFYRTQVIV